MDFSKLFESIILAVVMMVIMTFFILVVIDKHLSKLAMPYREHALRISDKSVSEQVGGGEAADEEPDEVESLALSKSAVEQEARKRKIESSFGAKETAATVEDPAEEMARWDYPIDDRGQDNWPVGNELDMEQVLEHDEKGIRGLTFTYVTPVNYLLGEPIEDTWASAWMPGTPGSRIRQLPNSFDLF